MSRTPVRGAIHWLQREGYVLEHPSGSKSRMMFAPLTKEDANELYMIIGSIEALAGCGVAQLSNAQRKPISAQLSALNDQLAGIANGQSVDPGEIFEIDRDFHRLIIKHGAGSRLTTLHGRIEPQTERYWRLHASSIINHLRTTVEEHAAIVHGVEEADADKLDLALKENWLQGAERLGHVIDIFGERGSW